MLDNEDFKNQLYKKQGGQSISTESFLLTLDRSQKLDLLIHLISNLSQSLVICGPNGIGKTIFLNEIKKHKIDNWSVHTILGSSNLSYERIQDQLAWFLKQENIEYQNLDLNAILSALNQQNQKIVILIDDAGLLVSGLISSLLHFSSVNSCLRIVFSLTHEEIEIKNNSDQLIEDCHFIEIPALTDKQCGIFLQNMSFQPNSLIAYNAINEGLIEKLYRETQGIPGKIISELPKLSNYKSGSNYKGIVAVVLVVAFGISVFLADEYRLKADIESVKTAEVSQQIEEETVSFPVVSSNSDGLINELLTEDSLYVTALVNNTELNKNSAAAVIKKQTLVTDIQQQKELNQNTEPQGIEVDNEATEKIEIKNIAKEEKSLLSVKEVDTLIIDHKIQLDDKQLQSNSENKAELDDTQWILAQPEKNLSIQLVVLSRRESVLDFLKNNSELKPDLKFFQQAKLDKKKYILIYGSFKDIASATKNMKLLPVKYRKSWLRKFRDLHKIINK